MPPWWIRLAFGTEKVTFPLIRGGDGEVYSRFPSTRKTIATTSSDSQMHFPQVSTWISGKGPYHEYGHILNMRAWDGTTGGCGDCPGGKYERDGDDSWSPTEKEYPHAAFTEGWANFVSHVNQNWPERACSSIENNSSSKICNADTSQYPDTSDLVTYPNDGKSYAKNVTKLLCDWYDDGDHNDDDTNMAGDGDHFMASLYSVWYNLDQMWNWSGGADGLQVCDYTDYYLSERKSSARVDRKSVVRERV